MYKKLVITESEKNNILQMYGILNEDFIRPLHKLMECKFTSDGKYVVYEGKAYSCDTGLEVPINEEWSLSDILHTGADLVSVGMDFVIPGSGAIIDTLNAISYVIEAQFKNEQEKDSLYLMAAITFGFVVLPGPLQSISVPLKRALKSGVGMTSKIVVDALKIIGTTLDKLLLGIPTQVSNALKSPLAKNIIGKWGDKITGYIDNFTSRIKILLQKITGKTEKGGSGFVYKLIDGDQFRKMFTLRNCFNSNYCDTKTIMKNFYNLLPSPNLIFNPSKVKILNKSNVAGREIVEFELENGKKILFYKSSGQNVAQTGKKTGEWFVIPGFAEDGWFIKTEKSIELTKGTNQYLTQMASFLEKNGVDGLTKGVKKGVSDLSIIKNIPINNLPVPENLLGVLVSKSNNLSKLDNIVLGNNSSILLNKIGIKPGTTIKTNNLKFQFGDIVDAEYILINGKKSKIWEFLKSYFLKPAAKMNTTFVPLSIKILLRTLNDDGTINQKELDKIPEISQQQSQKDLEYLSTLLADYEGNTGKYTINPNVLYFQKALKLLNYDIGNFGKNKDGVDGKFGPKTKEGLEKFQIENDLKTSVGKMDRNTARKLSLMLKEKNVPNSTEIVDKLNSI